MSEQPSFEGGVFSAELEGGRAGARLWVTSEGVHAETPRGERYHVPLASCQLERGGASGRMWFCRTPERDLTLFSEAPAFADALRAQGRRALGDQLDRIDGHARARTKRGALLWLAALAALALLVAGGLVGLRELGRASVELLPTSVDQKLGALAVENMSFEGRAMKDPVLDGALKEVVDRLARHTAAGAPRFRYDVRVLDAPIVNAFALPGGYIVVYTGLLRAARSPEQLAAVLAHEIAHVTRRHGMHRIARSVGVVAAIQLLLGDVSGLLAVAVELLQQGAINSYSRDQEHQADMDGVETLARAKIDPRALAGFFALLAEEEKQKQLPSLPAWLATHPDLTARIADVQRAATRLGPIAPAPLALDWADVQKRAGGSREPGQ